MPVIHTQKLSRNIFFNIQDTSREIHPWKRRNQILLCHAFAGVRSPRWLQIFKNAFNMVSTCPWYIRKSFLWGKISATGTLLRQFVLECTGSQIPFMSRFCRSEISEMPPNFQKSFEYDVNMPMIHTQNLSERKNIRNLLHFRELLRSDFAKIRPKWHLRIRRLSKRVRDSFWLIRVHQRLPITQ